MAELTRLVKRLTKEGKNFASIATLMPDGSPQVSAVFRAQCARNRNRLFGLIQAEITLLLILERNELKPITCGVITGLHQP